MRPYFIINEHAGKGKTKRRWSAIQHDLQQNGIKFAAAFTSRPQEATEFARQAAATGCSHVIAVGGDGTVHEVVNGLAGQPVVFGLVPTGTGNDLARMLELPSDPVQAVQRVLNGTPKKIDLLELNGKPVMNIVGFGFDAAVAHDINTVNWKKRAGSLGYVLSMLKMMIRFRPFTLHLELDGQAMTFENCWLVAVGNSQYYGGGMKICPDAQLDDGLLDVCVVNNVSRLQLLRLFPTVFSGKHVQLPQVTYKQGRTLRAQTDAPVPIHGDGEILGMTPCEIRIQPQAINVVY